MQAVVNSISFSGKGDSVLYLEGDMRAEVVPQMIAHAREFMDRGDAKFFHLVGGADARQHEQMG